GCILVQSVDVCLVFSPSRCSFYFFFQAEDGIRDRNVMEFRRVLFRSLPLSMLSSKISSSNEMNVQQAIICWTFQREVTLTVSGWLDYLIDLDGVHKTPS